MSILISKLFCTKGEGGGRALLPSPPPTTGRTELTLSRWRREGHWKGWALKITYNSQYAVQNTDHICSKIHVHKITDVGTCLLYGITSCHINNSFINNYFGFFSFRKMPAKLLNQNSSLLYLGKEDPQL
jgi:hypothetical protein